MITIATPEIYEGFPIPEAVRENWRSWQGVLWRISRYAQRHNGAHPGDQRFTVTPPAGMCPAHVEHWYEWRNRQYSYETGNRWPGGHGSPFTVIDHDLSRMHESRRWEWDEKTIGQMQLIEDICLSGGSPQCEGSRR